jgi:hypothetical protein
MKFGVREICDVVLRAKARQQVGNKVFYKNEPVIYFDTLKTSSMEGAATTVYAQGGRGNARLMAWEGERTVTFTMEDALISPEGFMILSGAGLIEAGSGAASIKQHVTETVDEANIKIGDGGTSATIKISQRPYLPKEAGDNFAYVMFMKDGEIVSEPYIPVHKDYPADSEEFILELGNHECYDESHFFGKADGEGHDQYTVSGLDNIAYDSVLVDYYVERESGAKQIEITPDKFGGNYYLEASTLFRDTNGVDMPAEFIIPNCKIQSNFTFTMASSGDPSSFTFTMDAFPDYTRFDHSKKVLAAIQVIQTEASQDYHRGNTDQSNNAASEVLSVHELTGERETGKYAVRSGDGVDRTRTIADEDDNG